MSAAGRQPIGSPEQLREAYARWHDPRAPEKIRRRHDLGRSFSTVLQELVTELEQELGHRPVFKLDVIQLPVEGQFWRRSTRDRVLVSEELMLSRNLVAPLESVIRELAR